MKVDYLVVHCSYTPDDRGVTAAEIHQWHKDRGWSGIGYHRIINRDGSVEDGRPEYWTGAHVRGYNKKSLGVCLIGRNDFTPDQYSTLIWVLKAWIIRYPDAEIVGHCDLDPKKTCPNFDVKEWWNNV
jgi:N-acetylmuramoyl-L-alanine amidase